MSKDDIKTLPLEQVQRLHAAYNEIITAIEVICGGPRNVGSNGEYWAAVSRRNMCRQVYNERFSKEVPHED